MVVEMTRYYAELAQSKNAQPRMVFLSFNIIRWRYCFPHIAVDTPATTITIFCFPFLCFPIFLPYRDFDSQQEPDPVFDAQSGDGSSPSWSFGTGGRSYAMWSDSFGRPHGRPLSEWISGKTWCCDTTYWFFSDFIWGSSRKTIRIDESVLCRDNGCIVASTWQAYSCSIPGCAWSAGSG